jgi:hypothetical protein
VERDHEIQEPDMGRLGGIANSLESCAFSMAGIYYIFDATDGKGYVGSAYGEGNLFGRWLNHAASGHGGNTQLRKRDPKNLRFTILRRVSPDMESDDVISKKAHGRNGSSVDSQSCRATCRRRASTCSPRMDDTST